jgi:hypothetical protein
MRASFLLSRWLFPALLSLALAAWSVAASPPSTKLPPAAGYSAEVSLEPMAGRAGVFLAKAVVKNLATERVEAAPSLAFPAGEEAVAESTGPTGTTLRLRVKADAGAGRAEIVLSLVAGSEERALQRTTVQLPRG